MSTYSFLNIQAALVGPGGSFPLGSGVGAAEEGITSAMSEEKNTATAGADGEIMHSLHASNLGRLTVRLLKTSPVNAQLSTLYNFQRSTPSLWGQNIITVTDAVRGDVVTGTTMAFVKHPDISWAKDGNTVEWEFVGKLIEQLGSGIPDVNT